MIGFPSVPQPSALLWTADLTPRDKRLQEECRDIVKIAMTDRWHRSIESLYQDALRLTDQGKATILMYLADISCLKGRLGPTLRFREEAERLFSSLPAIEQTHNLAVTYYALGLVHQLLGLENDAIDFYQRAQESFEKAQSHWCSASSTDPDIARCLDCCQNMKPLLEQLIDYVYAAHRFQGVSAVRCPILVGRWPWKSKLSSLESKLFSDDQLLIDVAVREIAVDMYLYRQDTGNKYKLDRLGGTGVKEPMILPGKEYFVVEIPQALRRFVWFRDGEYALVCKARQEDYFAIGAEKKTSDNPLWGRFTRNMGGDVLLVSWYEDGSGFLPAPRLVAEDELEPEALGIIVGIFKKVID